MLFIFKFRTRYAINQERQPVTTLTLQQACDACQTNKTAWLNRKTELDAAMQEYQELLLDDNASGSRRLQTLRDLIDVKNGKLIRPPVATSSRTRKCSASASVTGCMILCSRTAQRWPPHWHRS